MTSKMILNSKTLFYKGPKNKNKSKEQEKKMRNFVIDSIF